MLGKAFREQVIKAVESLPSDQRVLLVLYYVEGHSVEEISQMTGRPKNQVPVYMQRAREALKRKLCGWIEEGD